MSKNPKHVIAVARTTSPILTTSIPSTIRTSGQVERSAVLATWVPLPGYSTVPYAADSTTQKHREEKEPKNMSVAKGGLN
ncbi:hypothetical protein FPCIR_7899 [Fusarium pseudocircinatum]|uniref:Uncharacterized protein n=1 Tax=Fusarium pseudocircinatum TaxID=56676 RepID=A0A8H5L7N5_9HYPO|nr:hypothetical protein FPCIR_7899 [Fusarium pseudocircinatum]